VNERLIYKWLGYGNDTDGNCPIRKMHPSWPPLDMNTWHREVVPKLSKEADVTFRHGAWGIQPWKQAWRGPHWVWEDPWLALTKYLEAK